MENIALFECINGLSSHFECSFKNILEIKHENFSMELIFCMPFMKFLSKRPYSKKPALPRKISGCTPATFSLTFHPSFHRNILAFANLPIYRKLFPDNTSLVFWNPRISKNLVLFWRSDYFSISVCLVETLFTVILKKIYFYL